MTIVPDRRRSVRNPAGDQRGCLEQDHRAPGLAHAELNTQLKHIEAFDLAKNTRMQKARNEDLERARAEDWEGC